MCYDFGHTRISIRQFQLARAVHEKSHGVGWKGGNLEDLHHTCFPVSIAQVYIISPAWQRTIRYKVFDSETHQSKCSSAMVFRRTYIKMITKNITRISYGHKNTPI